MYVCSDDETREQVKMDVARFLVRTKYSMVLNETFNMEINDNIYRIKMVDDMHEPKYIIIPKEVGVEEAMKIVVRRKMKMMARGKKR